MSAKTNLTLDIAIFSAFLVASNPAFTGLAVHEWLSVAFAATLVLHLLFHWKWIATLTKTFFKNLLHASRLDYVVDGLLFVAMTAAMLSGLMISRNVMATLGISLPAVPAWRSIHSLSSNLSLVLVAVHFGLHWKWVVTNVGRNILAPLSGLAQNPAGRAIRLTTQSVKIDDDK